MPLLLLWLDREHIAPPVHTRHRHKHRRRRPASYAMAPMVLIVLAAFGLGCAFGIFAMVPSWWRHRRPVRQMPAFVGETGVRGRARQPHHDAH